MIEFSRRMIYEDYFTFPKRLENHNISFLQDDLKSILHEIADLEYYKGQAMIIAELIDSAIKKKLEKDIEG